VLVYILKRLALTVPTLLGLVTLVFLLTQFVPGGPIEQLAAQMRAHRQGEAGSYRAGGEIDPEQLQRIKALYGFDRPPLERYVRMLSGFARFDLGDSFQHNKPVGRLLLEKLPVSISLGAWTLLVSYLVSIPLGIAKAVREGSRFDVATTVLVLAGYSIPGFALGVFLIVIFAGGTFLEWFPLRGLVSDNWSALGWGARIRDYFWHLTLPLSCLVVGSFAVITMLTKNTFLEEIRKQYVLVARAKGLEERVILYRHVLRNALIPLVTGLPSAFIGAFFAGDVLIESLFSLDGIGLLSYESIIRRDFPVVIGAVYVFALAGLLVKVVSDTLYTVIDPRVHFGEAGR
jgi:microcin C transport system permease protein